MTAVLLSAVLLVTSTPPMTAQTSTGDREEALRLLEAALVVAQSIEEAPLRADAVGRVAGELARLDPRRALGLVEGEVATHQQSEAMARAAEGLARDNRFLGLATLIRVGDRSAVLEALGRIVAMEALTDLDEAIDIVEKIDNLPVRRVVEREVARLVWMDIGEDERQAVEVAVLWADTIGDPVTHHEALAYAAEGAAGYDLRRAEEIADRIPAGDARDLAWRLVAQRISQREPGEALRLLARIETPLQRNLAAVAVLGGLAKAGQKEEALALAREVRLSVERDMEDPRDQGLILAEVAVGVVDLDAPYALSVLTGVWPPARRYSAQCRVARSDAHPGPQAQRELLEDAWVEVRRTDSPALQRQIASATLAAAEDVARDFIETMEGERPALVQAALPDAVRMLAIDEPELALSLAARIDGAAVREMARAEIAAAAVRTQPDLAKQISEDLTVPSARSAALVSLASAATRSTVD